MRTEAPAWFKTSFLDLPDNLAEARAAGKLGLMLLFSTEGCAHCKAFIERSLKDSAIGRGGARTSTSSTWKSSATRR